MGNGPEYSEAFKTLEQVVIPFMETAVREERPLFLEPEHVAVMRGAFAEAGVNYEISERERESLLNAPHLRLRAKVNPGGLVTGVEIYDRALTVGKTKWRDFDPSENLGQEPFLNENGDKLVDRTYGLVAALSGEKTKALAELTYKIAIETKIGGKIGGHEGTQGRGGLQQAADLLRLTFIDTDPSTGYELNLLSAQAGINQRLEKSLLKVNYPDAYKMLIKIWSKEKDNEPSDEEWKGFGEKVGQFNERFKGDRIANPTSDTSSFSPNHLTDLIRFLASK